MLIDTKFNVQSDAKGGDPDSTSPTLKKYHKILWSKELPSGKKFELTDQKSGAYLYHNSELGEFYLGSDAITHSYANQKKFKWITEQIPEQVQEVYYAGSTIGAYLLWVFGLLCRKTRLFIIANIAINRIIMWKSIYT